MRQKLASNVISLILMRRQFHGSDQKRPDGLLLVTVNVGRLLLWDLRIMKFLVFSRTPTGQLVTLELPRQFKKYILSHCIVN